MAHSLRSNLQLFLDRLTRRSLLSDQEQQAVLNLPGHAEQVAAHRDFVVPGRSVDHACLVVGGIVGRFDDNREGRRQITTLHIPGDMCDLHSVVLPRPSYALQALSVATILQVPHISIKAAAGATRLLLRRFGATAWLTPRLYRNGL
jgi:CRP-like cAMP-binding protein